MFLSLDGMYVYWAIESIENRELNYTRDYALRALICQTACISHFYRRTKLNIGWIKTATISFKSS